MALNDHDLRISLSDARTIEATNSYARSGILRIGDLFSEDVADALHHHLDQEVEWGQIVSHGDKACDLTPHAIALLQGKNGKSISLQNP